MAAARSPRVCAADLAGTPPCVPPAPNDPARAAAVTGDGSPAPTRALPTGVPRHAAFPPRARDLCELGLYLAALDGALPRQQLFPRPRVLQTGVGGRRGAATGRRGRTRRHTGDEGLEQQPPSTVAVETATGSTSVRLL